MQPWHPAQRSAILASAMGLTVLERPLSTPSASRSTRSGASSSRCPWSSRRF